MARIARVVVPGIPHHVTQRGNRRLDTFFTEADYLEYLNLMADWCSRFKIEVWAYCLMTNHVHLIVVPESEDGLYRWSSAKAHLLGEDDILVNASALLGIVPDWRGLLASDIPDDEYATLRRHERSGRPLGNDCFLAGLEKLTSRILRRQKPGPKTNN